MSAHAPQCDAPSAATVCRLVDDPASIPDHRDRRGRVYPWSSLLAIHMLAAIDDGHGPEGCRRFCAGPCGLARGRLGIPEARGGSAQTLRRLLRAQDSSLRAELQSLVVRTDRQHYGLVIN